MYKKPRESCFCYEIYTEYSVSMRSPVWATVPACYYSAFDVYKTSKHLVDDSDCLAQLPPDTASYFIHMCKLILSKLWEKFFPCPFDAKSYEKGNSTRQMWAANCPPCDGNPTDARLKSTQPGSPRTLHVLRLPKWSDIGQRLVSSCWLLQTVLACRAVCELFGLSRARKGVVPPQRVSPTASPPLSFPIQDPSTKLRPRWSSCLRERSRNQ